MRMFIRKKARTCAMRGRNPENPSDRRKGIFVQQRAELGGVICNCLTTVAKDTLVFAKVIGVESETNRNKASN